MVSRIGRIEHVWGSSWPSNQSIVVGAFVVGLVAAFVFGITCSIFERRPVLLRSFILGIVSCLLTVFLAGCLNSSAMTLVAFFSAPAVAVLNLPRKVGCQVQES